MSERTPNITPQLTGSGSLAPGYFERMYATLADPWEYESSYYERDKYAATLASLPRDHYVHALELGCSIGVLTAQLAKRCDSLLAIDVAESALNCARQRCRAMKEITFQCRDMVKDFPDCSFDLIVVSEVGYYLSFADLVDLRLRIAAALVPGGHLVLVHYTQPTNYPLTGNTVHEAFVSDEVSIWRSVVSAREKNYRLDVLERLTAYA